MRSLLIGGTATAVARFHFKTAWPIAVIVGLGAIVLVDFATEKAA